MIKFIFSFDYSILFPYNNHFFALSAKDLTLHYAPKNGIVLDVYSAWAVFGKDPAQTAAAVTRDARLVSTQWNAKFSSAQVSTVQLGTAVPYIASLLFISCFYFCACMPQRLDSEWYNKTELTLSVCTLQMWQKRSHKTRYALIGENSITKTVRALGKETTAVVKTQLLLTVSNYHFNVEAAKQKKDVTCAPADCKISLKFSSEDFIPKTATDVDRRAYHFDKNAFCVSYGAFMSLLADQALKEQVWPEVLQNYKESTGVDLESHDADQTIYFDVPIDLPPRVEVEETDGAGRKAGTSRSRLYRKTAGKRPRYASDDEEDFSSQRPPTPMPNQAANSDHDDEGFSVPDVEVKIAGSKRKHQND